MEFLKNLKLDDKADSQHAPADGQHSQTSEGHHASALFGKLANTLSSTQSTPPPVPVATSAQSENIFDKIGHTLGGRKTPPPPSVAAPAKQEGLFDKIGDVLSGNKKTPLPAPTASTTANAESFIGKLSDALSGDQTTTATPPPTAHHESGLLGKLSSAISGEKHDATPPPAPKEEGFLGKLTDALEGHKEEPTKPQGLFDKVNNALGGGAVAEHKEDHLDKAIDLFQEHILKEGAQHNESAVEQLKDKQIAKTIREQYEKATGHEFFIKEKK
ncbi:hypothetical protein BDQ12DRAFT_692292 [Crucibulum laeve]|uniref:Uncharacterized protein n=1 Tax=Crucibulum laeve TaxID=68775 RepID=A0A5C3LIH9_9AGAR|nr:hypothetical protein BDQ12DRAFT_692292 [Crucibulum laeve]